VLHRPQNRSRTSTLVPIANIASPSSQSRRSDAALGSRFYGATSSPIAAQYQKSISILTGDTAAVHAPRGCVDEATWQTRRRPRVSGRRRVTVRPGPTPAVVIA
jgi:hypothetical protein